MHTRTRPLKSLVPQFEKPPIDEYEEVMGSLFWDAPRVTDMLRFREELRRHEAREAKADFYEPLSWRRRKF